MYLWSEGVSVLAAMFSRDVNKREVSSLFSMVAPWLRCCRLADQNNSSSSLLPSLPSCGPWTGERDDTVQHLRRCPAAVSPTFRPLLRFLGDWTAPARACGVNPSLMFVVYLFTKTSSSHINIFARPLFAFSRPSSDKGSRSFAFFWCCCVESVVSEE